MNNAKSAEAKLDSYFVSNLHLAYTFKKITGVKSLRVGLSVYNVFSENISITGMPVPGITWKMEKRLFTAMPDMRRRHRHM